ncbi:hypothetical protein CALCODRAFT_383288 [Calocera cornea HHB12733]|uniref:Uncharacterized protein n=1 Tax=Calocera cornea HHB12733 TaxID=1353952 RepID=A0A165EC82_9BASI|nr:hypothetical protein CALCODRAFT_383288 [Calocera cornea HHB12733]
MYGQGCFSYSKIPGTSFNRMTKVCHWQAGQPGYAVSVVSKPDPLPHHRFPISSNTVLTQ